MRTNNPVGVPQAEALLTETLINVAAEIYSPGTGRVLHVIPEPDFERGRPDALIVAVSPRALDAYLASGLVVRTPSAARAVETLVNPRNELVVTPHLRRLINEVRDCGWDKRHAKQFGELGTASIAIEAKMHDWRQALRQIAHWGQSTNKVALLMPIAQIGNIGPTFLDVYDVDLLGFNDASQITIVREGGSRPLRIANQLWIMELLRRSAITARAR